MSEEGGSYGETWGVVPATLSEQGGGGGGARETNTSLV